MGYSYSKTLFLFIRNLNLTAILHYLTPHDKHLTDTNAGEGYFSVFTNKKKKKNFQKKTCCICSFLIDINAPKKKKRERDTKKGPFLKNRQLKLVQILR